MRTIGLGVLALMIGTALPGPKLHASVWYVRRDGSGDGSSWDRALPTIRSALLRAAEGDSIWIAEGTYRGSLSVGRAVSIYGGFAGGETELEQRNPELHTVVIVADEKRPALTVGAGVRDVILDGLVFQGSASTSGGGLFCPRGSKVTVINARIENASSSGTALHAAVDCAEFATAVLQKVQILNNRTRGIYCGPGSSIMLEECRIERNLGGALECRESQAEVKQCLILGNRAAMGSVLLCTGTDAVHITNSTICGNTCWQERGIIYCRSASPEFKNCIFAYNPEELLNVDDDSAPQITHSCFDEGPAPPGEGNIAADPAFEGWGKEVVFVSSSTSEKGDGTVESPYRGLDEALASFSFALRPESPCRGSGEGGSDMGPAFPSPAPGLPQTVKIYIAPGSYTLTYYGFYVPLPPLEGASSQEVELSVKSLSFFHRGTEFRNLTYSVECTVVLGRAEATFRDCIIRFPDEFHFILGHMRVEGEGILRLEKCTAMGGAAAMVVARENGRFITSECLFKNGRAVLSLLDDAQADVRDCRFENNQAVLYGKDSAGAELKNCAIFANGKAFTLSQSASITGSNLNLVGNGSDQAAIAVIRGGTLALSHITAVGNRAPSFFEITSTGRLILRDSILWKNIGPYFASENNADISVSRSCLDTGEVYPGEGNIAEDPLFVGWAGREEIFVDSNAAPGGDGSPEAPLSDLSSLFEAYDLALCTSSPCLGKGENGSNMGAFNGVAACTSPTSPTVRLKAGTYQVGPQPFPDLPFEAIEGEGADNTFLVGQTGFLGNEIVLRDLTIAGSKKAGLEVLGGQKLTAERCAFKNN